MATHLTVNINRQHLGKITLEESGERYALEYAQSWLDGGGFPVSPHLKPGECSSESVRRFLANLLPEGRWLEELAISTHISRANIFGLVAVIGTETTGALTFRMGGTSSKEPATSFRSVTAVELAERISQRQFSFFVGPGGIDMAPAYDLLNYQ